MRTIAFHTLGCKVNQYDTEAMRELFERAGWTEVAPGADADAVLVNTCTVTGTGDQKSHKLIRRIAREHPHARIAVSGCLAQREAENVLEMDNVALVLGTQRRSEVVELLERAFIEGKLNAVSALKDAAFEPLSVARHEGRARATMKIQEGCDRNCAYCIIPSVRGPVRSMELDAVAEEAKRLAGAGYLEIVLTGIHLASYGRGTEHGLLDAIEAVAKHVPRVRLGSLEPLIVTGEFAERIAAVPQVMPQFHLSLQSGSAGVLRRMRRRYTKDEYMRSVERLRGALPGCAITTDILTGFPGETDAEADETLEFVRACAFARIHVFPYSRRKGTAADAMDAQIPEEIKRFRAKELLGLGNKLEEAFVESLTGTVQQALFERPAADGASEGYTGQYVRVVAGALPGEIRSVRILRREGTLAFGEVTQDGR